MRVLEKSNVTSSTFTVQDGNAHTVHTSKTAIRVSRVLRDINELFSLMLKKAISIFSINKSRSLCSALR